jgi:hypothetical protein
MLEISFKLFYTTAGLKFLPRAQGMLIVDEQLLVPPIQTHILGSMHELYIEIIAKPKILQLLQGCKLLSDIGQCPTKFGKCPSKTNFDRTLVRSKNILSHYTFFAVTKSDCKFTQFAFCNKIYQAWILAFYLTLRWNGYTYLSRDLYYILWRIYVRPNSSYVRPKLKVIGQMSCQVKYLFAALLLHLPRMTPRKPSLLSNSFYTKFLRTITPCQSIKNCLLKYVYHANCLSPDETRVHESWYSYAILVSCS